MEIVTHPSRSASGTTRRIVGRDLRAGVILLRQTNLGGSHQRAGHLDLVAVLRQHVDGSAGEHLGVVEQPSGSERLAWSVWRSGR